MRTMLKAILILLMLTVAAPVAMAGNFPEKPISVIVPWKPGGGTDILARAVCPVWEKYLGVSMRIVNKPGGNNIVGYSAMFAAPHDGYTIVLGQAPNYNINVLFQDAPYKIGDMAYLNLFQRDDLIFYANKEAPWNNLAELVADARKRPGEIQMGAAALKGMDPVYVGEFEARAGIKFGKIVPMGGGGPLKREVIGGHMPLAVHGCWVSRSAAPLAKGLGVRRMEPSPIWPEAQIFNEVLPEGKKYTSEEINLLPTFIKGFAVPADVKTKYPERFAKLVSSFEAMMKGSDFKEMLAKQQLETAFSYYPPEKTQAVVNAFTELLKKNSHFYQN